VNLKYFPDMHLVFNYFYRTLVAGTLPVTLRGEKRLPEQNLITDCDFVERGRLFDESLFTTATAFAVNKLLTKSFKQSPQKCRPNVIVGRNRMTNTWIR
jgi:hypothetical protein